MAGRLAEVAPGVLVATSEICLTTSTVVAAPDGGCLVIDPAVTVADLAALAAELAARGLRPRAGFSTHPHWDHVLWHHALGDVPRYAAPRAVHAAETERDAMVAGVEDGAPGHDLALFGRSAAGSPRTCATWTDLARGRPFGDSRLTQDWLRRDHDAQLRFAAGRSSTGP
jgi:glyoxylase-like metal-dependent hydrolase (beta-lactamase superfamily II)